MTVYELRQIRDPGNASGSYRRATDATRNLLETWVDAFSTGRFTAARPGARKWAAPRRRRLPYLGGRRRAGVLCRPVPASGKRFCTLFADVKNSTVNDIYQRRGFEPLGEFVELVFE